MINALVVIGTRQKEEIIDELCTDGGERCRKEGRVLGFSPGAHATRAGRDRQEPEGWRPQEEQGDGKAEEWCLYPNDLLM